VVLGYDWDGAVAGDRRIGQVFTSTFAGGGYSRIAENDPRYRPICCHLLRAAYVGTLLAAASLGRPKVVLTQIGGGAFANPIPLIWDSILWAIGEVEPLVSEVMDVVLNRRNLKADPQLEEILPAVRTRGGAVVVIGPGGPFVRR
jgi:hypothetical protein